MSKVGILSMQRICNYGSFLQAYALKSLVESLGHNVVFVDYHIGDPLIKGDTKRTYKRIIHKVNEVFSLKAPLKCKIKYILYKKNYSKKYLKLIGVSNEFNYNAKVDTLIIGSDEVFNCIQSNSNVGFSLELFGANNNASKVISYAASFGNTTIDKIYDFGINDILANYLQRFDQISVRDRNSFEVVTSLTSKKPVVNLDPVLMYDFSCDLQSLTASPFNFKYMILYGYNGRFTKEECKYIKKYAIANNLKIVCIGGVQHFGDVYYDNTPLNIINCFRHSECVITDTFHGSILSIINNKKFLTITRNKGYGNSQKVTDLLTRLELLDRIVYDFKDIDRLMTKHIKWEITNDILDVERRKTITYLLENI